MTRHKICSTFGSVLLCFFLLDAAFSQEKLTSYRGEAVSSYISDPVEFKGKLYFFPSDPNRKLSVYEYDPAENTSELLFREDRNEGFSILRKEVIYDRLFLFDYNTIFEVDVENRRLITVRKFDELRWISHVYHNDDLLYIIGTPYSGSDQEFILIYNLHDDFLVDFYHDPRTKYGLIFNVDRRNRIPDDEIVLSRFDGQRGIYIYDMTRQTVKVPNGSEDTFDKQLDGFLLQNDSTYLFYDRQRTVWSLNLNSNELKKEIVVDSAKVVRSPVLTDNYLVVPAIEPHLDFTTDSYVYRKHLETGANDTSFFPGYALRDFDHAEDFGAFADVRNEFSFIDFDKSTITSKHSYEDLRFSSYIGFDAPNDKAYFTAKDSFNLYTLLSSASASDTFEFADFPQSEKAILKVFSSDTVILFQKYDPVRGNLVYSLKNEEIKEVMQVFKGFSGHEYSLHKTSNNLYGSNNYGLFFDVENTGAPFIFPGAPEQSSYKRAISTHEDRVYMIDNSERDVIWEISNGEQSARRINLSHQDSIEISASELYATNSSLLAEIRVSGNEFICNIDVETGVLDCLIDTSNINQYRIWGGPVWLGNQLCLHLETKDHGRELWAISKEVADSYMVLGLSADSADSHVVREVIQGEARSIFYPSPSFSSGLMSSDGTQDGTFIIKSALSSVKTLLYYDGYFYLSQNNVLLRTKGLDLNGDENLVYTDRALYHVGWDSSIFFVSTITNPSIFKRYDLESDEITEVTQLDRWPREYYPSSSYLFYTTYEGNYLSLWSTDGTPQNSHQLVGQIGRWSQDEPLFVVGDKILFSHYNEMHGSEIWISDGTPEGTELFLDINPGAEDSYPLLLADEGGYVYFSAVYEQEGRQLFRVDREEVSLISSLEEITPKSLEVFPNPAQEYIHLGSFESQPFQNVRIFAADGVVVKNISSVTSEQKINLGNIVPGVYFISAECGDVFYSGRFVKAE